MTPSKNTGASPKQGHPSFESRYKRLQTAYVKRAAKHRSEAKAAKERQLSTAAAYQQGLAQMQAVTAAMISRQRDDFDRQLAAKDHETELRIKMVRSEVLHVLYISCCVMLTPPAAAHPDGRCKQRLQPWN